MEKQKYDALVQAVLAQICVPLEASARHVHLTREQAQQLFGHDLTPRRPLSQPGQFLAQERVTLQGPKGKLNHVAVLGPVRKEAQVEISLTDGKALGIDPPIRASGDVVNSPGILLLGEHGNVAIQEGVIAAQRHLHLTPATAERFRVRDKQIIRLQTYTNRPVVFENVLVRVSPHYADTAHLDFDEANACAMQPGDWGRILL